MIFNVKEGNSFQSVIDTASELYCPPSESCMAFASDDGGRV